MKLVVLLRRPRSGPDGAVAPRDGDRPLLGRCDEAALHTALALRAAAPGGRVTAIAAGPPQREDEVLAEALAAGADAAVRVHDAGMEGVDYLGLGRVLSAAARHVGFDLVLAGDRSEDELQAATGPAVAEWLGLPHLTGVRAVEVTAGAGCALAERRDPGVVRTVKVPLPAVLTIAAFPGPAPARAGAQDGGERRRGPPIEQLGLERLGIQVAELRHRDRCIGRALPVRARNATLVRDAGELVARLRDDRLIG